MRIMSTYVYTTDGRLIKDNGNTLHRKIKSAITFDKKWVSYQDKDTTMDIALAQIVAYKLVKH